MIFLRRLFCFCLLVFPFHAVYSQNGNGEYIFTDAGFQNYTMKNGLSSDYCYDVLQDKKGALWFATLNGLCRFNGTGWTNFEQQQKEKKYRLPGNWVIDLSEDKAGNIWINTDRGFCVYDQHRDSIMQYQTPVYGWGKICCDKNGQVMVSSWQGVHSFSISSGAPVFSRHYSETENNSITQLFNDQLGNTWICPEDHPSLFEIQAGKNSVAVRKQVFFDGKIVEVKSVASRDANHLLLSTAGQGLLLYNPESGTVSRIELGEFNSSTILCSMVYTLENETYIVAGTASQGLVIRDEKSGAVYSCRSDFNNPKSILSDQINAICADNNDGIWIASSRGISYFHPSLQKTKQIYFRNTPGFPQQALINAFASVNRDSVLIGTDNDGLFLYSHQLRKMKQIESVGNDSNSIRSLLQYNADEWLIASSNGLFVYNRKNGSTSQKQIGGKTISNSVIQIRKLNASVYGICTYSGLILADLEQDKILLNETSDSSKAITKDVLLIGNSVWILRYFDGCDLYNLNSKTYRNITPAVLKNKAVNYPRIQICGNSVYIASTYGIIEYPQMNPDQCRLCTINEGLQGDMIENIVPAFSGNTLFYSTTTGIFSYDPLQHQSKLVATYENYPQKWFNQFGPFRDSSLACTISDELMIIHPALHFKNRIRQEFEITGLLINDQPQTEIADTISLNYLQNSLSFMLALPVYPESEKNRFYYQLSPGDTSWRSCADGRINLFHLAPNSYRLRIYTVNNEGIQSAMRTIFITIRTPFWRATWFYVLLLLLIVLIFAGIILYRRRQQEKINLIRNQISRDLHDELGANVSSINIMARMLLQQNNQHPGARPMLDKISAYSVQISDTINDIIWNVNPRFDSLEELVKRMTRYASESLEAAGIHYHFDHDGTINDTNISSAIKYNLYLIFKEAINNASKYSNATEIRISFRYSSGTFGFSIIDNGIGFTEKQAENGNGIGNMKSRAKELGAAFELKSEPAKGTTLHLNVRL